MKQIVRKITAVMMALVVLMSTMSFTVFKHYCGNTLVDTSYFTHAEGCGMEPSSTETLPGCDIVKKNCCADKSLTLEGQKDLKVSQEIQLAKQFFAIIPVVSYQADYLRTETNLPNYRDYHPPPLVRPIFKLEEKYLI